MPFLRSIVILGLLAASNGCSILQAYHNVTPDYQGAQWELDPSRPNCTVCPGVPRSKTLWRLGQPNVSVRTADGKLVDAFLHETSAESEGLTFYKKAGYIVVYDQSERVQSADRSHSKKGYQQVERFITCCKKSGDDPMSAYRRCHPIIEENDREEHAEIHLP